MEDVADIDSLLWHFARLLPADRRYEFCQAAQNALTRLRCPGPGLVHRTLAELLPDYFVPTGDYGCGGAHRNRRPSKLTSAAPLA